MAKAKKTGGRVAGTPNKRTADLIERLEARFPGWHPVESMAILAHEELGRIANGSCVTPDEMEAAIDEARAGKPKRWTDLLAKLSTSKSFALDCLREVSQYVAPKRKAIEHSGPGGTGGGVLLVPGGVSLDDWVKGTAKK